MWPFKRRRDEENESITHIIIPIPNLLRNILYDSLIKDPETLSKALGLPPISEEVSEKEEEASQERLDNIAMLVPLIETHSQLSAKIIFAGYASSLPADIIDEEQELTINSFFELVCFASALSCVSTLVDLQLLEPSITGLDVYGK